MNLRSRITLRCTPLLLAWALCRPAEAQTVHSPSAADALFKEGRQAAKRGDIAGACALFRKSYSFDPAPGTLMNIADCEEQQGQLAEALRDFKLTAESLAPTDERLPIALSRAAKVDQRMPHVVIHVLPGKSEPRVLIEGVGLVSKDLFDKPIALSPGTYTVIAMVDATAKGQALVTLVDHETENVSFDVASIERKAEEAEQARRQEQAERQQAIQLQVEQQQQAVQAQIAANQKAAQEMSDKIQKQVSGAGRWGTIFGGGFGFGVPGLVCVIAGGVTGSKVLADKETVEQHCNGTLCDRDGVKAAEEGRTLSIVAPVLLAAGTGLVSLAVYFVVKGATQNTTSISVQPIRTAPGIALTHTF